MSAAVSLPPLRLLVVEDEAFILMLIEDMLEDLGCTVAGSASRVADALAFVEGGEAGFDGAILDVALGTEAIDPVVEALRDRGVPFVLATGYGAALDPRLAGLPILAKPFQIADLEAALREHVAGQTART